MSKICRNGHCGSRLVGKNTWFQLYIKQKSKLVGYLDLLNNVLCFLHALLHLIKQKMTKKMLSTFPFYRWGNWDTEALMKLAKWMWWFLVNIFISTNKLRGKGHSLASRLLRKKNLFSILCIKKKNKLCYLDLSNVLGALYTILHLIKKIQWETILNISILYMRKLRHWGINEVTSKWKRCFLVSLFICSW